MRRCRLGTLIAALLVCGSPGTAQKPARAVASISKIEAKLYFPESGEFSQDMLAVPRLNLWNSITGAGWAEHPSNATLVLVEVSGDPNTGPAGLSVELTVADARNDSVIMKRRLKLGFAEADKQKEAFWLYGTGCVPLKLKARLVGQGGSAAMVRSIPFACGE